MLKNLNKFIAGIVIGTMLVFSAGCTRIETGYVGLRVDATKQVQGNELNPGGPYQTMIGDVLEFLIKDINVEINDKKYTTSDNTALSDFDLTVIYSVNPTSVSDLYTKKSRSFHGVADDGDILLMKNYVTTVANNASYKVVRTYPALGVADNRAEIETKIMNTIADQLKADKLDTAINVSTIQIRAIVPNAEILNSATAAIRAENELKRKNTEVEIAKKEAERMQALANNSKSSIELMNAQSLQMIAQGVQQGKVKAIVVPVDFKGLVQVKVD